MTRTRNPLTSKQLDLDRCNSNLAVMPATLVLQLAQPDDLDDMEIDKTLTSTLSDSQATENIQDSPILPPVPIFPRH